LETDLVDPAQMSAEVSLFQSYRDLIDDWDAFVSALERPLPLTVWENPLKARDTGQSLEARWARDGIEYQRCEWLKPSSSLGVRNLYRLNGAETLKIGLTEEYLAGLLHVQEEVSVIPPLVLAAAEGDRVLDLCAAPGNKTAQLALDVGPRGLVVGNDRSLVRIRGMRRSLERLGLFNVGYTLRDGTSFIAKEFDHVLADVPCGCEGTSRKSPGGFQPMKPNFLRKLRRQQELLLEKAIRVCRPGGAIVYSTCTYSPEENEAVIQSVLDKMGSWVEIEPVSLKDFNHSSGVTKWQGQPFTRDMKGTIRVWPHQNDSGGFFIAKLRRKSGALNARPFRRESALASSVVQEKVDELEAAYGFHPQVVQGVVSQESNRKLYLQPNEGFDEEIDYEVKGMGFAHLGTTPPKLSTSAAMRFGHLATRRVLDLTPAQLAHYLAGEDTRIEAAQVTEEVCRGFVMVRHDGLVFGMAVLRPVEDHWNLQSLYPKPWRTPPTARTST
jgi:16S rRNA C967 or C1407 C5-methylase (RsmB/RsmF family)/NOL1/NOP2/fmu family ribosome biogenesis protein